MTALLYRMPAGIAGALSRPDNANVEPVALDSTYTFSAYGRFGKTSASGTFIPLVANDAASVITGILVRPFPTQSGGTAFGPGTPPQAGGIGDRLQRGYISVVLNWGAAVKDGQVYVCNVASGNQVVGDIGATNLGGDAVAVPGCYFTGPSDTTGAGTDVIGQAEIFYDRA
jgi:hypothetical protein